VLVVVVVVVVLVVVVLMTTVTMIHAIMTTFKDTEEEDKSVEINVSVFMTSTATV
jgi:hypothetical protein